MLNNFCEHTYIRSRVPQVTLEDLQLFHFFERELFKMLIIQLARDPAESLLVMAFWLCLEKMNYPRLINRVLELSETMLIGMANEAVACISCLEAAEPLPVVPPDGGLPLTSRLLNIYISLETFSMSKFTITSRMKDELNNICSRVFTDILLRVVRANPNNPNQPVRIRGFPHPIFGEVRIIKRPLDYVFSDERPCIWSTTMFIPVENRTMFLTFSRGFPVTEEEVRNFFTVSFGNCIESIQMGSVPCSGDQSLYATMVLHNVEAIDLILRGKRMAKFRVHGKHVWARKYEPKDGTR